RSALEGKDLIPLGFGGNAGAQTILANEVYRAADPFLKRLLDAAVGENAVDHRRIHFDQDVDVAVWAILTARHRAKYCSMDDAHSFEIWLMRPKRSKDTADQGSFSLSGFDIGGVTPEVTLHERFDVVRQGAVLPLCSSPRSGER